MVGIGAASYTVGSIIDRLYLQFLTPPDAQDILVPLGLAIPTTTETTLTLGTFQIPEDEALMRQGVLIELEHELVRVVSYNATAGTIEVLRGQMGTVAGTYTLPLLLTVNPPYARSVVYEAISDNIRLLTPKLYTTSEEFVVEIEDRAYSIPDPLAVSVIELLAPEGTFSYDTTGEIGHIVEFHPVTGGRTLITPQSWGDVWMRFRRKTGRPAAETDTLDDLGVDDRWIAIVITGAAADLLVGRDISAAHTEWVQATLESENIEVGRRTSVAGSLRQYRNTLLRDAQQELDNEFGITMDINEPLAQFQNQYQRTRGFGA